MRGSLHLGAALLAIQIGAWLIGGHHSLSEEGSRLAVCLGVGLQGFALARFGLLVMAGSVFCSEMLAIVPLTAELSAWYAPQVMVIVVARRNRDRPHGPGPVQGVTA